MSGKLMQIKTALGPKTGQLKRKLAGAALIGALSVSCAPETIQITAKSPIQLTAAQPKPKAPESKNPAWDEFSEKYSLTEKSKSLLEERFILVQDKTGFWSLKVFDVLMKNSSLRRNHLEKSCRLISSVLKRTDSPNDAKDTLSTFEYLFNSPKVGGTELDIMLDVVESSPELGREKLRIMHNTAAMFRSNSYSPEFLRQMQRFLLPGGVMGNYITKEDKALVLDAFHAFSTRGSDHSWTFATISEIFKIFSERVSQLAEERGKEAERIYGKNAPNLHRHMYFGVTKKDAAIVILSSFLNPKFNQQMFEDLISELKTVIYSDYADSSTSKSALKALADIYRLDFFDSGASSELRSYFKKQYSEYNFLRRFLEAALTISKGRNFRYSYDSYLFVGMLRGLNDVALMLAKNDAYSKLPTAAKILASSRYYAERLGALKSLIKHARKTSDSAVDSLYAISQSKGLSPKLLSDFIKISKKISRINGRKTRGYAFSDLSRIIRNSKNHPACLSNLDFVLNHKRVKIKSTLSVFSLFADQGILVDDASFQKKFERAKLLAQEAGARYKDPEVCVNFAYALESIGKEQVLVLHEKFGIEYFGRYPKEVLEELLRSGHPHNRRFAPVAFSVYNKDDWNGAFYHDGHIFAKLMKTHTLFAIEVASDKKIPEKMGETLKWVRSIYGNTVSLGMRTISVLVIGGHGNPGGISLGNYSSSRARISSSDMRMFRDLKKHFVKQPTVILVSCSTGKSEHSIGARISKVLGARLFAPKKDGNISGIKVGPKGEILNVEYTVPSNEFESGRVKRGDEK